MVVTNGQDNEGFQGSLLYVINHHLGNSVSNSWETDLDLISGAGEQQSYDSILALAAAKGISVNFATGDSGDSGIGSPVGAAGVPSDSPHATAVGGTAILNIPGSTSFQYTSYGHDASVLQAINPVDPPLQQGFVPNFGGGGGGESTYFAKPAWQKSLPGTGRQTPDISALAGPLTGVPIVFTYAGVVVEDPAIGGTSVACPIFSAIWAIANQKAGHPLGQAAPIIAGMTSGITDVVPTPPSSLTDVAGIIYDASGSTYYSPSAIFGPAIGAQGSLGFVSVFYGNVIAGAGPLFFDLSFGTDTSLTVTQGWDNATGYGSPNGLEFINAAAK